MSKHSRRKSSNFHTGYSTTLYRTGLFTKTVEGPDKNILIYELHDTKRSTDGFSDTDNTEFHGDLFGKRPIHPTPKNIRLLGCIRTYSTWRPFQAKHISARSQRFSIVFMHVSRSRPARRLPLTSSAASGSSSYAPNHSGDPIARTMVDGGKGVGWRVMGTRHWALGSVAWNNAHPEVLLDQSDIGGCGMWSREVANYSTPAFWMSTTRFIFTGGCIGWRIIDQTVARFTVRLQGADRWRVWSASDTLWTLVSATIRPLESFTTQQPTGSGAR